MAVSDAPRILLVDPHRLRRRQLAAVLARAGYRVIESPSPDAAAVQKKLLADAVVLNVTEEPVAPGSFMRCPDHRGHDRSRGQATPL
jgi:hypothetical protein